MSSKTVLVTVGTTQFEDLIEETSSFKITKVLQELRYTDLTLQIGNGKEPQINTNNNLHIEFYRFKNSISDDIKQASLVISHAGSGSILDVLGAGKSLLVVINEKLMDNHQIELAKRFAEEGFLYFCTLSNLEETLKSVKFNDLKPYKAGDPSVFANYLDNLLGFSKPDS